MTSRRRRVQPQRARRRKAYAPELSARASDTRPRGAFRLFSNYRLFAIIGGVSIVAAYGLSVASGGTISAHGNSRDSSVRGEGVRREAPRDVDGTPAPPPRIVRQYVLAPPRTIDLSHRYLAVLETDLGTIQVELDARAAPEAVNNFVFLARDGFYDGVTFHRVIPGFVAQAGDPTGTGIGGPGYDLPFEPSADAFERGLLAVARPSEAGAPNSGSQFFFALGRQPALDGRSTALGRVISGMEVLESLTPRDPQAAPDAAAGDTIRSVSIIESE